MQNYYKDTWTKKGKNGAEFFKNVDFSHRTYQFQEHVFRQHLLSYRNFINMGAYKPVESVLELGAGTGRMTKIMLEIFPDILNYDVTDLMFDRLTLAETIGSQNMRKLNWYSLDITSDEFNLVFAPHSPTKTYDFILASEVFMHIKPEDIGSVIEKCCKLLVRTSGTATITNIDWSTDPDYIPMGRGEDRWCWIHNYDKLYRENGLRPIFTADIDKQKLFCYGGRE